MKIIELVSGLYSVCSKSAMKQIFVVLILLDFYVYAFHTPLLKSNLRTNPRYSTPPSTHRDMSLDVGKRLDEMGLSKRQCFRKLRDALESAISSGKFDDKTRIEPVSNNSLCPYFF